ncbi:MAG: Glycosyltransferase [uncultured Sulfurovum sp.]|uniref:Glycosyltransferase n=1 Tax=uncultured Sulfurovum sp. TaxID=269237 RepID=A0A6S6TIZ9_9BACT|nr:MAG: Glycosyltransferase [uncultured Sulfurovum sp.]
MLNIKKNLKYKNLIDENNFFDEKYYLKTYQDARLSTLTAIEHFTKEGLEKGYKPNESFDPIWYANYYSHLKNSSFLPVVHFLTFGKQQNYFQNREEMSYYTLIKKSALFDSDFYANSYDKLNAKEDNVDLLLDYVRYGEKEGKNPNATFDVKQYNSNYKDEVLKLNISAFEHYMLYHDEINDLVFKAKENMSTTFKKNYLNIVALLPDKIENENRVSMLRVVAPLTLSMVKEKIFFKALPHSFDFYEIEPYDTCILYANTIREQQKAEELIDVLKKNKIELIVYVEKEENHELDSIITYLLDHANVSLFSTKDLMERYPSKVKRKFILPKVSELELLNKDVLEFLALTWLQSIQKVNTIVDNSDLFGKVYYIDEYADLKRKNINPLWHYYWYGWRENRIPSAAFDIFWYQEKYLQDYVAPINPVLHYELIGKDKNYEIKPEYKGLAKKITLPTNPKRITLFAGYDKDGIIDESVIVYVKELAKYSDVYFLSDSILSQNELDKLSLYTKGAWAYRHGEYDFGSYKRLAEYHVGWERIEQYDELLFVNDSSYLLSSLDNVFSKMSAKKTSFWGMQATKGRYGTKEKESNKFSAKIPIDKIKKEYMESYFNEDNFDFHLGSYFLAFRSNVIKDKKFQKFMAHISKERNKITLILKYEIGLSKYLIGNEYDFETYMDDLYPYHPIYTNRVYDMIEDGFPLFKRLLIVLNHYREQELYSWKKRLLSKYPALDLKPIEENIIRVGDATAIYKNLDVEKNDEKIFSLEDFIKEDKTSIIEENLWIFPVNSESHILNEKSRAFLEKIKDDTSIKKVILYRSKAVRVEGMNMEALPLYSKQGQNYLLKSSKIFVGRLLNLEIPFPLDINKHEFININNI